MLTSLDWLSRNLERLCDQYSNKWIAIRDEKVIASSQTVSELIQETKGIECPFITFLPSEPIIWVWG